MNVCKHCGKEYKYTHHNDGTYKHYCSSECREKAKEIELKNKNSPKLLVCEYCGKEYLWENKGNWNINNELVRPKGKSHSNEVVSSRKYCCYECGKSDTREKREKTNLERYGNKVAMKSEIIRERHIQALAAIPAERKKEAVQKRIETNKPNKEKICENISKSLKKTWEERGDKIREKTRQTCLERYGVESTNQLDSMKQKSKQTCLDKFGFEYAIQSPEVRKAIEETNLRVYGTKIASQSEVVKEKISYSNSHKTDEERKEILNKRMQTCFINYGVKFASQCPEIRCKIEETNMKQYGKKTTFNYDEIRKTNLNKYGVQYTCLLPKAQFSGKAVSKINKAFNEKLLAAEVETTMEFSLVNYSFDIKCGNTLVEVNPTYTHNSTTEVTMGDRRIPPKEPDYHMKKSQLAQQNGFRCIHIWDWDDENKIINLLKPRQGNLYARNLDLREVSMIDTFAFLDTYHIQGSCGGQDVRLGLYNGDTLVELMTFGKPRYNRNCQWELLRLCTKPEYNVVGGAKKLFKAFVVMYNPESIVSYCDNSKFTGEVYSRLGMKLTSFGKPSKHWFNVRTGRHITDNLLRQRGFSQLHGDSRYKKHNRGESNEDLMHEAGYLEIYDCGQSTYIWTAK